MKSRSKILLLVIMFTTLTLVLTTTVYAASVTPDADQVWRNIVNFFATWIGRLGLLIAFIGAVQWALGRRNDDADAQSRGINFFASGVITIAITQSLHLFGLT